MRDLLLIVALVAWLLVELLWPQVKADTRDPDEVMLEELGGSAVHESAGLPISDFEGPCIGTSGRRAFSSRVGR